MFGLATLLTINSVSLNAQTLVNPADQSWYPSAYGAQDEIGAANLLTPEVVKQALGLVKQGKTLALAVPMIKTYRLSDTEASIYTTSSPENRVEKVLVPTGLHSTMNW